MMRNLARWLIALSLVLAPVQGQDETSWENLQKLLKSGDRIRVLDVKLASLSGNLAEVSADHITVQRSGGRTTTMSRTDVVRVSRIGRHNVLSGTLIGGGAGAAAGVGVAAGGKWNPDYSTGQIAAIFGISLAAIGAAIGAVIGVARPDVHVIYRAPAAARTN